MKKVVARACRDGNWWAVQVPINGGVEFTQGKTLQEAQVMAEDLLAIWGEELDDDELRNAQVVLSVDGDVKATAEAVRAAVEDVEAARERMRVQQVQAVASLRRQGLTLQDISTVLGVTKGRVCQIAHAR